MSHQASGKDSMDTLKQTGVLQSLEVPYGKPLDYDACMHHLKQKSLLKFYQAHPTQASILCGIFVEIDTERLVSFFYSLGLSPSDISEIYNQASALGAIRNIKFEQAIEAML